MVCTLLPLVLSSTLCPLSSTYSPLVTSYILSTLVLYLCPLVTPISSSLVLSLVWSRN